MIKAFFLFVNEKCEIWNMHQNFAKSKVNMNKNATNIFFNLRQQIFFFII